MYRIQPTTLSVSSHFPRGLTTLGISWLGGQFEAVALHKGEVAGTWRAPDCCDDVEQFSDLARQAVEKTGFQGNSIHLVLSHAKLTHLLVEVPDARGPALKALVQRQVERLKSFDEPAAWTFEKSEPTKTSGSAIVHILPQAILQRLQFRAGQSGLQLASVTPPTGTLHAQLARLPLDGNQVGLIATDFQGSTTIVVGRREGPLFLARSLDGSRTRGASALVVDVNRTLLFVSQRFGTEIAGVWLFGQAMSDHLEEFRAQLSVPVTFSPEAQADHYWTLESLRAPADYSPNLVSAQQLRAPQRKALLKLTTVLASTSILGALAAAASIRFLAATEERHIASLAPQAAQLEAEHRTLQQTYLDLARRERFIQGVLDQRPGPIPVWLTAYLGEVTPPDIAISHLQIRRETNLWRVTVTGRLQASTPSATTTTTLRQGAEALAEHLRSGPFHATVLPWSLTGADDPASRPKSAASAFADWAGQRRAAGPSPIAPPTQFTLTALLR
ncbi:MAG: hypothetical protein AB7O66_23535 [Limisphaerales bacterium]